MEKVSLEKDVVIVPAQAAVVTNSFTVLSIEENYGCKSTLPEEQQNLPTPMLNQGKGQWASVRAEIMLGDQPTVQYRNITVWENEEYFAVKNTWTDADLFAKIKQILESE